MRWRSLDMYDDEQVISGRASTDACVSVRMCSICRSENAAPPPSSATFHSFHWGAFHASESPSLCEHEDTETEHGVQTSRPNMFGRDARFLR